MTRPAGRSATVATLVLVGLLAGGLLLGAVLAFWQAARTVIGPVTIPWGLLIALGAVVVAVRAGVNASRSRWGGAAVFTGWLLATIAFATQTPWAGDVVITSGGRQVAYLLVGVVLGSAAASVRWRPGATPAP